MVQDLTVSPIYEKKEGIKSMYIAQVNISDYATPWIMWGGPQQKPGSHIGNIKIGYKQAKCPESYQVIVTDFQHCLHIA